MRPNTFGRPGSRFETRLISLVFALHNHQPVGNFENVFREAFEKCYDPFVGFLEEHPAFRTSLHYSGCLFDWLERREKQFLKRLERLVRKNQVELLSGGYYEPLLPLIPERDAVNQMRFMNQYLKSRFGKAPTGFWLTERVWEAKIPRLAAEAGLQYTVVDDTHFALAGVPESQIRNFFITEEEGRPLFLFPIPKALRYVIPFREPEETLDYLRDLHSTKEKTAVVTYADDGEKLGLWPGTYQWVYRDGWLERFASALEENRSWLSLKTFSEVLQENNRQAVPKVYLPSASYEEMSEWSMNPEKGLEFLKLRKDLEAADLWNRARSYFQGGTFKNFLAKYPESDWMHSKMVRVSRKVAGVKNDSLQKKAERELWQGQCNCPYWHGVFGGLYLHHLRRTTYEHLIRAEQFCTPANQKNSVRLIQEDLNQDGAPEWVLEAYPFTFSCLPHRGGSFAELDYHPQTMNVLDTVTRREEVYHREVFHEKKSTGAAKSIHDLEKMIPAEVMQRIAFDPADRFSFLDFMLEPTTSFEEFWKGKARAIGKDPVEQTYEINWTGGRKGGTLSLKARRAELVVIKNLTVKAGENQFKITWSILNDSQKKVDYLWGMEWRFNFYDRERKVKGTRQVEIQDSWSPVHLTLLAERPFDYWQYPIETVAQTEKDYRLLHQGISVFPHWSLALAPQKNWEGSLIFRFSDGKHPSE